MGGSYSTQRKDMLMYYNVCCTCPSFRPGFRASSVPKANATWGMRSKYYNTVCRATIMLWKWQCMRICAHPTLLRLLQIHNLDRHIAVVLLATCMPDLQQENAILFCHRNACLSMAAFVHSCTVELTPFPICLSSVYSPGSEGKVRSS